MRTRAPEVLAALLLAGCAHAPPPGPPPDPCAAYEEPGSSLRRPYSGPEWVVGVGHASGVLSAEELREKANASAASDVASQLLVRVQSTLDVDERSSSEFGAITRVQSRTRAEVKATDLPGLRYLGTCNNPWTLTTVSVAVLHKGEARDAMVRLLAEDAEAIRAGVQRARASLASGSVVQALSHARGLAAVDERRKANARLAATLGDATVRTEATEELAALGGALASRKTVLLTHAGEASEVLGTQAMEAVGSAVTQAGWRVNRSGPAALKVHVAVGTCSWQEMAAVGGVRTRCPVDVALWDEASGQLVRSFQSHLEGVGPNRQRAAAEALRKGAGALQFQAVEALRAIEQETEAK